jgi:starch-binding outer membrane protein, SusD/RagB family
MKNIIRILFASLFTLLFYSCEKFLDLKPLDNGIAQDTSQFYFKGASDVESYLSGIYSDFKNEYFELDYFVNGDAQSDDAYAGADNPANFQIDGYTTDALNSNVSRDWAYLYSTIGKTNIVINNVEVVTELTETRRNEIKGEASFIRAFLYFQLVQLWGDVPLQLKDIKTFDITILPDLFPERSPKAVIYSQIIADLETALVYVGPSAPNKGYVTRGAVNSLLAKVYATQEPHDWNKVIGYCNDVIAGGYSLLPEYNQLWDNAHKNSSESIFEINYAGTASDANWGASMFRGLEWKKFNIPSNDLVGAFDAEQDSIRKPASIIFLDVTGHWSDANWPQTHYPFINKYRDFVSPSSQNYIFIRLADILLLKAEALNENGDVDGAAVLVNQIRNRAKLANTTATTQDAMRLAIEKERRLELAFEGIRWFDLKRTGRAIEVINSVTDFGGVGMSYHLTENRLIWPIPQSELDKSSNLTQNPGY